ncbi:MAG: hypothetical protein U1C72_00870, partial [Candidatus Pacearchaeota archaeon]|nr:hypothetical protein [Candidatus Pacearchaeota archaeon]
MLKILAFAFLLVGLFVVFQNTPLREVQAQGGCGSVTFSCNLKPVFREESNECGGNLLSALKSYTCETSYDSVVIGEDEDGNALWGCEEAGTSVIAGPHYTTPTLYFTCGDYRRPDAYSPDEDGSGWYEQATCECSGSCYPAPDTKEVSDPSLDPANVLDESRNPKLPVNLGWKDNVKKLVEDIAPGYACSIGSYNYEVTGNGKTITGLEQENLEDIVGECQLTPDTSYEWRVRACLDAGGQDCGAWSQKAGFETSDAPELLSPFDEDFENKKDASVPIPTILEWCPVPQAPSYLYRIYEATGDEKKEITTDAVGGGTTQYNDELVHRILNKGVRYFWEVALCTGGISGCGSLSQLWSFVPGELELKTPILKSPKYVPGQQEPAVNMLSRLEWDVSSYAQIYLVQIRDASKTRSFFIKRNFLSLSDVWQGNLSLDSSYTWRVAACTGESLDRCQKTGSGNTSFSDEWRFRPTGAPPTGLRAVPTENGS